jgi:hypothetical protein
MKITFNRGNQYFDTYHICNESGEKIGMLEDHCRGVKERYFVGWRMDAPNSKTGKTELFSSKEDAIKYATGE